MLVFVLVFITLCPFYVCNHLDKEERACCFVLLSFWGLVTVNVLLLFRSVPWVGLQCVIVVFPDHTHLLFGRHGTYITFNIRFVVWFN